MTTQSSAPARANASLAIDVMVVGSINVDVCAVVDALPRPGETITARSTLADALGGKGANQAAAAAALDAKTLLVGAVGKDSHGPWLTASLAARGVDTAMLLRSSRASGWAHVIVDAAGENLIIVEPGANADLTAAHVLLAFARYQPTVVMVQLEIPMPAVTTALQAGRACGALTLCNASPVNADFVLSPELMDYLIVNRSEAQRLSGMADPDSAIRQLAQATRATVLMTMGADGVMLATDDMSVSQLPAVVPASVVDTTGAGDIFAGALAGCLARTQDLGRAVSIAQRAASWSVSRLGVLPPRFTDLDCEGD